MLPVSNPYKRKRDSPTSSSCTGNKQHDNTIEVEEQDYNCPICMDFMLGPILQCIDGHLICQKCFLSLASNKCPTCRREYPDGQPGRNRALEMIVQRLNIQCKNGCRFIGKAIDMFFHLRLCRKRLTQCIYNWPSSNVRHACCDHYVPFEDLAVHYREEHPPYYQAGKEHIIPMTGYREGTPAPFSSSNFVDGLARITDLGHAGNFVIIRLYCFDFVDFEDSPIYEHTKGDMLQVRAFHAFQQVSVTTSIQCGAEVLIEGPRSKTEPLYQLIDADHEVCEQLIAVADAQGLHLFALKQLDNVIQARNCGKDITLHILFHDNSVGESTSRPCPIRPSTCRPAEAQVSKRREALPPQALMFELRGLY